METVLIDPLQFGWLVESLSRFNVELELFSVLFPMIWESPLKIGPKRIVLIVFIRG